MAALPPAAAPTVSSPAAAVPTASPRASSPPTSPAAPLAVESPARASPARRAGPAPRVAALHLRLHMPPLSRREKAAAATLAAAGRTPVRVRGRALYAEHMPVGALALADATPPPHIVAVATIGDGSGMALVFT
jgi:hypothetical protein